MNLPRPNLLRQELTNIGVVYIVVLVLLVGALIYGLIPGGEYADHLETPPPEAFGPAGSG
ncbi:MAG: hypothetical protein HOM68_27205 [Gemmatimonadetes bacterium]|nr:hypothetical protein [Gemmatimonadota bacterium]MBT4608431.1 hypothetical protein [Gemmatimonadota bacterium]MBT5060261.1 hypothetical protein [Gemmatimonadota bacterium]MBT5141213.1 hypothetical protein [Gemmatimonadota bacterium]MBT5588866.1 hypothetical protein [Gemmatimonadota bacterium]